ncbi:CHAT domain containing protein [Hyaloscypha variabilis]
MAYMLSAIQLFQEAVDITARLCQEAANATPADHPDHISAFSALAYCYEVKYNATKSNSDLEAATASCSEAFWDSPGATIGQRLDIAKKLVSTLILSKNWHEAWCIVCEAIPMIRGMTPRFLENSERQALLSQHSSFASDAAAVTLSAGREPIEALQHLEECRVIAAVAINELRISVSRLSHFPPEVGKKFLSLQAAEIREVFCKSTSLELKEPDRRKEDVLLHLRDCYIFHFAAHSYTDVKDPSQSHLRLENWTDNPLRVADLLEINLYERSPFLAYLSACGTGRIEGKEYLDESIHLITACQLAGFRHVTGTLWEVRDEVCVDVTKITYEGIRDGSMTDESLRDRWLSTPVDTGRASRLIRKENEFLGEHDSGDRSVSYSDPRDDRLSRDVISCDEEEAELLHWVPYVHFGVWFLLFGGVNSESVRWRGIKAIYYSLSR